MYTSGVTKTRIMTIISQSSLERYYSLYSRIKARVISSRVTAIINPFRRVSGQYMLFLAGVVYGGAVIVALELYCR